MFVESHRDSLRIKLGGKKLHNRDKNKSSAFQSARLEMEVSETSLNACQPFLGSNRESDVGADKGELRWQMEVWMKGCQVY